MSESRIPNLADVQCEVCHGSDCDHIADNSKPYGEASKNDCITCYTGENSPVINFPPIEKNKTLSISLFYRSLI